MFSCEFWEISKNIFFTEHLRTLQQKDTIQFSIIYTCFELLELR